jgi:hypothetical protein
MEDAWKECKNAILKARKPKSGNVSVCEETLLLGKRISERCRRAYDIAQLDSNNDTDISDEQLTRLTRFTDRLPLQNYSKMFSLVPELVNIVTVLMLKTKPTSQLNLRTLPIFVCTMFTASRSHSCSWQWNKTSFGSSLHSVQNVQLVFCASTVCAHAHAHAHACACSLNVQFRNRFAAVQLAFSSPRCRILIFRMCSNNSTVSYCLHNTRMYVCLLHTHTQIILPMADTGRVVVRPSGIKYT